MGDRCSSAAAADSGSVLGLTAAKLIAARLNLSERDEQRLISGVEASCRRFDPRGRSLTPDEFYNVIKLQHGIPVGKNEVRSILAQLPQDKQGRVKIDHFVGREMFSEEVFKVSQYGKYAVLSTCSIIQA